MFVQIIKLTPPTPPTRPYTKLRSFVCLFFLFPTTIRTVVAAVISHLICVAHMWAQLCMLNSFKAQAVLC